MEKDNNCNKIYDLEERTAIFAERIIRFCNKTPRNVVTIPIIGQLVRAGTSPGANYREANGASSSKDFRCKIYICKKEVKETDYWLRLILPLIENSRELLEECAYLRKEAQELTKIFSKIAYNTKA